MNKSYAFAYLNRVNDPGKIFNQKFRLRTSSMCGRKIPACEFCDWTGSSLLKSESVSSVHFQTLVWLINKHLISQGPFKLSNKLCES